MTRKISILTGGRGVSFSFLLFITLPSLFLSGCAVGPNYKRPAVTAPPAYRNQVTAAQQASLADLPWWEVFKDETLQGLVKEALTNNYDLRVAVARVEQARQVAAQAHAQYLPAVGYQGTISGGRNEFLGSVYPGGGGQTVGSVEAVISAAWELDLWGRIRRLNEASQALYLASEQTRRGVLLSLVSDVAQAYFELLELDLELEIAKRTTQSFTDSLKLFTLRFEGGVASQLETARAEAALANTAAFVPELERQIALKENQISVLLGRNPGLIARTATMLQQIMPPDVPAGLPSALLERRPDVRQAEEQVRFANARIGVAKADFFPRIGLTALLGRASFDLSNFTSGQSNVWSAAGSLAGPIYQGGALKARKRQFEAAWQEATLSYQQTALTAFLDVANALVSREKYEASRIEQARAVAAYGNAVKLSTLRYVAGKASYFEVLEAQIQLFPAENALAVTQLNQLVVIVQLYKALGGGWNLKDPDWAGPTPAAAPATK